MKKFIKTGLIIFCFVFIISCDKNKKKSAEQEGSKTEITFNQDVMIFKQNLEIFDQKYSDLVKNFYTQINRGNTLLKDGVKDENEFKNLIVELSSKDEMPKIEMSRNLQEIHGDNVRKLQRIYEEMMVLKDQFRIYLDSTEWEKDDRKMIYNLNAKAEELTAEYERFYNQIFDKIEKEQ